MKQSTYSQPMLLWLFQANCENILLYRYLFEIIRDAIVVPLIALWILERQHTFFPRQSNEPFPARNEKPTLYGAPCLLLKFKFFIALLLVEFNAYRDTYETSHMCLHFWRDWSRMLFHHLHRQCFALPSFLGQPCFVIRNDFEEKWRHAHSKHIAKPW